MIENVLDAPPRAILIQQVTRNSFELEVLDEEKDVILLLYSKVKCSMAVDVTPILSRVDTPTKCYHILPRVLE